MMLMMSVAKLAMPAYSDGYFVERTAGETHLRV